MSTKKSLKQLERISGQMLTLGGLVKAIREGEDWTQVDLAEILSVSKQYVCDMEHGRRVPSPKLAADYARKLGYSEEQFVRLTLQAMLNKDKIPFVVVLKPVFE